MVTNILDELAVSIFRSPQFKITVKIEAASSSETLVTIYLVKVCSIPQDLNLHQHWCENLKSHKWTFMFTIIHSNMFRFAKQLQPSHIHRTIFWVQQPLEVEKISNIAENMMLPPSISNTEKVMSGGSHRNTRLS